MASGWARSITTSRRKWNFPVGTATTSVNGDEAPLAARGECGGSHEGAGSGNGDEPNGDQIRLHG